MTKMKQSGITITGVIISFVIIFIIIFLAGRVFPVYKADMDVRKAMRNLQQHKEINYYAPRTQAEIQIKDLLAQQLQANELEYIPLENLEVLNVGKGMVVTLRYERKVYLFSNISLLFNFNDKAELVRQ